MEAGTIILIIIGVIALAITMKVVQNKKRRQHLLAKYGDLAVVEKIMRRTVWQGMSEGQLIDSWGPPVAKDQKVYKTKVAETFKYNQRGKNRFGSRVRVENGIVVGWEQK